MDIDTNKLKKEKKKRWLKEIYFIEKKLLTNSKREGFHAKGACVQTKLLS